MWFSVSCEIPRRARRPLSSRSSHIFSLFVSEEEITRKENEEEEEERDKTIIKREREKERERERNGRERRARRRERERETGREEKRERRKRDESARGAVANTRKSSKAKEGGGRCPQTQPTLATHLHLPHPPL